MSCRISGVVGVVGALVGALGAFGACGGGDGGGGGDSPDAATADAAPPPAGTFLATWNLREWAADAVPDIAALARPLGLDLLAIEEVGDEARLAALATALDAEYAIGPLATAGTGPQLGLVWRAGEVEVGAVEDRFVGEPEFPRPALRAEVHLVAPAVDLTLWVVHLKAGTGAADEQARLDAVTALEAAVTSDRAETGRPTLVVGDFNEAVGDPRADEVFASFVDQPTEYSIPTLALAERGTVTFLPASIMLDHVVLDDAMRTLIDGRAPSVPRLDAEIPDYATAISDHLPVVLELAR